MLISIDSEQRFVMMKYRLPAVAGSFYPVSANGFAVERVLYNDQ